MSFDHSGYLKGLEGDQSQCSPAQIFKRLALVLRQYIEARLRGPLLVINSWGFERVGVGLAGCLPSVCDLLPLGPNGSPVWVRHSPRLPRGMSLTAN